MQVLYRNLWAPKEIRTLILSILLLFMSVLLELVFLFFPNILESTFFAFLLIEVDIFGGTFQPLFVLLHLIAWSIMFFTTLIVYTNVKEYTGGRTGLIEIGAIIITYVIIAFLIFDFWFSLYLIGFYCLIIGYMYYAIPSE
ncbi:MAG: hypothetical protein ACTSR2_02390 [Candidatus Hodarchaeales archaeon]